LEARSVESVLRALNDAGVRYLIAGDLAVVAHGYVRFTKDIDVVIALDESNARSAVSAFAKIGYRPTVAAVKIEEFCDPDQRRQWIEEKDAKVFQLYSDDHRMTPVDIFIEEPFDFDLAYARALCVEYAAGIDVRVVALEDLLEMKRAAGRPQDSIDVEQLEWIHSVGESE
jgi:predicted nucleotidyltransferase